MPDFDDSPSSEGASNVVLNQRALESPFARSAVNIQGDEHPGKAIGFTAVGRLSAIDIYESPFVAVDDEADFDSALVDGRSVVLRGEGTEGVIALTTPKTITARHTEIRGPGHLRFTLTQGSSDPYAANQPVAQAANPRGITVLADDVTLRNFEMSATQPWATNTSYAIGLSSAANAPGHRLKLLDLHLHDWSRFVTKDAIYNSTGLVATPHDDILIERLYAHDFNYAGLWLNYGFRRLVMRDSRVLGTLNYVHEVVPTNPPTHHNALAGGMGWWDCTFENCHFGNCGRIGFEALLHDYPDSYPGNTTYFHERTRLSNCRVENCSGMGISVMFCRGAVLDRCKIKDVHFRGIEVGGRCPESAGPYWVYGTVIVDSCEVDGVNSWGMAPVIGGGQANGIILDCAEDSVVRGSTVVKNITSTLLTNGAAGIAIVSSERCSVKDAILINAGHRYICVERGESPNTRGFHEIVGNTMRNNAGSGSHQALYILDTRAEVHGNTSWQKAGTDLLYCYSAVLPAYVTCDGGILPPAPAADTVFPVLGTNLIMPVP